MSVVDTHSLQDLLRWASEDSREGSSRSLNGLRNAPIRCLPIEILTDIFRLCTPSDDFWPKTGNFGFEIPERPCLRSYEAPLSLCHICSDWRQLAVCTPSLWTHFAINLNEPQEKVEAETITWLTLSKSSPLSISLYRKLYLEDSERSSVPILDILLPHAGRLANFVTAALQSREELKMTLFLLSGGGPSLKNVSVIDKGWTTVQDWDVNPLLLVERLRLRHVHIRLGTSTLFHLQELYLNCEFTAREFVNILQRCPNLQILEAQLRGVLVVPGFPHRFCHPKLEVLNLLLAGNQSEDAHSPIFEFLEFPVLRELRLESGLTYSFEEAAAAQGVFGIAGLLQRSCLSSATFVPLEKLLLKLKLPVNDSDIVEILQLARRLKTLFVNGLPLSPTTLLALTRNHLNSNELMLCPDLHYFSWSGSCEGCSGPFHSMISSRWDSSTEVQCKVSAFGCSFKVVEAPGKPSDLHCDPGVGVIR